MSKVNIGILGAGNIAGTMAATVKKMKNAKLYAIASRDIAKAERFAVDHNIMKAYGSYEDLVKDRKVDLVYIASPHSEHYEHAKLCLENGKAVLCEKAFTVNAEQARELVSMAHEKNILLAEGIWTRYMPMLKTIREVLESGIIGEPTMLTANLGYLVSHVNRMTDPWLAGGALLDLGVYPLNFASMIFGTRVEKITSACTFTDTGVDEQNSMTITYKDGKVAVLNSSMVGLSDRKGLIYCTKGFAVIENINNFESMTIYDVSYKKVGFYKRPKQISGYEYEVEACIKAIKEGKIECGAMPHEEIIRIMEMMDEIRGQWGMKYPFENQTSCI